MKGINIHYGKEVRLKITEKGMSIAEFARRIGCSRTNVYDIFRRRYINLELLEIISEVLDYDFLHKL